MKYQLFTLLTLFCGLTGVFADGPGVQGRVFEVKQDGSVAGLVAGAKIEFINGATTTTDAAGFYKVTLSPGSYLYKVTAPGFKDEDSGRGMQLQLSDGFAVYNFALTRGESDPNNAPPPRPETPSGGLEGRVFEKITGNPGIGGAEILLRRDGTRNLTRVISATGKDPGNYEISLPVGTWRASVSAVGFTQLVDATPIEITAGNTTKRDFEMERPVSDPKTDQGIRGGVRIIPGQRPAVKLNEVSIRVIPLNESSFGAQDLKSPKGDGQFEVRLAAGPYRVEAGAKGYETAVSGPVQVFPDRYSQVKLVLRGDLGLKVEFFVFDAETKLPLAGTAIQLQPKDGNSMVEGKSDRLGQLSLRLPEEGNWNMQAIREGYANWSQTSDITGLLGDRIMIPMKPGTSTPPPEITKATELRVTVLDAQNRKPVAGASVTVRQGSQRLSDAPKSDTDSSGHASFKLPGKGEYTALVRAAGFKAGGSRIELKTGESKQMEVLLESDSLTEMPPVPKDSAQSLSVHVVGDGQPVAGAVVSIIDRDRVVNQGLSDVKGIYRLAMPVGTFTLRAEAQGYEAGGFAVTMKKGKDANVLVTLTPKVTKMPPAEQNLTLNVQVNHQGGRGVPGATVSLIQGNRVIGRGLTDQLGRYQRIMPEPGIYTIRAEALGLTPGTAVARLGKGSSAVEINLTAMNSTMPPVITVPEPPGTGIPGFPEVQKLTLSISVIQGGGVPIPGAVVSVAQNRKVIAQGVTDQRGVWTTYANPGIYSLKAEARGYQPGGGTATVTNRSVNAQIQLNGSITQTPNPSDTTITPPTIRVPKIPGMNIDIKPGGKITIPGMRTTPNNPEINPKMPQTNSIPNQGQAVYVVEGLAPGQSQWQVLGRYGNAQQAQQALSAYRITYGARKWQLRINTQGQ